MKYKALTKEMNKTPMKGYIAITGGGLLQKHNRDTQRFAFKCSAQRRSGIWHDIQKNPLEKSKASKKGRLKLINDDSGEYVTLPITGKGHDILQTVFLNGELIKKYSFEEIRNNAALK